MAERERNLWVDYAKGIGILLVVYGHVVRGLINAGILTEHLSFHLLVDSLIYSFHMPLFFFLSGLFFSRSLQSRGPTGLVLNKVDTVFYPFVLWSLLQGTIEVLLARYTNGGDLGMAQVLSLLWSPRAQFWFLWALFMSFALCALLIRRERYAVPALLGAAVLYWLAGRGLPLAAFHFVAENLVFLIAGILFARARGAAEANAGVLAFGSSLAFVALAYWFHIRLGLRYESRGWMTLAMAFAGILASVSLCMLLARRSIGWLLALGALSMPIYLMHILAGSGVRVLLASFLEIRVAWVHVVIGCTMAVLAPVLAARIIEVLNLRWLYEAPAAVSVERWRRRRLSGAADPVT